MQAGYREKRFAIVGVKVYAAGLYVDLSILDKLDAMKGKLDASLFDLIFQGKFTQETVRMILKEYYTFLR